MKIKVVLALGMLVSAVWGTDSEGTAVSLAACDCRRATTLSRVLGDTLKLEEAQIQAAQLAYHANWSTPTEAQEISAGLGQLPVPQQQRAAMMIAITIVQEFDIRIPTCRIPEVLRALQPHLSQEQRAEIQEAETATRFTDRVARDLERQRDLLNTTRAMLGVENLRDVDLGSTTCAQLRAVFPLLSQISAYRYSHKYNSEDKEQAISSDAEASCLIMKINQELPYPCLSLFYSQCQGKINRIQKRLALQFECERDTIIHDEILWMWTTFGTGKITDSQYEGSRRILQELLSETVRSTGELDLELFRAKVRQQLPEINSLLVPIPPSERFIAYRELILGILEQLKVNIPTPEQYMLVKPIFEEEVGPLPDGYVM